MIYYVTVCFRHSNLEIKIEYTDIQLSPIFFRKMKNIGIMPKQISISDKSMLFDGCPTDKLRKI